MPADTLLEVKGLKMHFALFEGTLFRRKIGAVRAIDGIDFSMRRGETLGLVGESGCGKSTTARAIAQLHRPTAGSVIFEGRDLTALGHKELLMARKDMQLIFQDPYASLNPRMTVGSIIAEPLVVYSRRGLIERTRKQITARVAELMEQVGLSPAFRNRYPREFSGGQRQRIGIARALALEPKLILADEPVSALDVSIQAQILNLLKDLQKSLDLTFLFIAHDMAVIKHICDRVAVMYLGKIVETAAADELYERPLHPYTKALVSAIPIPDPEVERTRTRIILSGEVPSPVHDRSGCYFYERCPHRMADICPSRIPKLETIHDGHEAACWLYPTGSG